MSNQFISKLDLLLMSFGEYKVYRAAYLEGAPHLNAETMAKYQKHYQALREEFIKEFSPPTAS